ncbi:hypothetical protein K8I28_01095 [bacterium]|nr:hypothetical protein [bacterium]
MNLTVYIILPVLLILASGGLLGYWIFLFFNPDRKQEESATRFGFYLSLLFLLWGLGVVLFQKQAPVLNIGQLLVFLGVLIWWGQTYVQRRVRQRMLVILPLAVVVVLLLAGMINGLKPLHIPESVLGGAATFHIMLSMAGVAMLLGSGVYGAGELTLHRQIKRRSFGRWFTHLPSLGDMDKLRRLTLFSGWLMIIVSLALALGGMYMEGGANDPLISHLHPMLTLAGIISLLVAADKFRWLAQQKLAFSSVLLSALVLVLIVLSVVEIFWRNPS